MADLYPLTPNDDVAAIKREDREYYERYGELVWVKVGGDWMLQDPESDQPDDCAVYPTRPDDWDLINEKDRHEPSRGV